MSNSKITKFIDKKGNSYPYLYVDQITGTFYIRKRVGERVLSSSLETRDFNKARSLVTDKIRELLNKPESGPKKNLLFMDFYELMIDEKRAANIKDSTMTRIETVWRLSLEPFWAHVQVGDIDRQMVIDFMTWHKRKRPGVQFVNVFKYLGNVFNVMVERGAMLPANKPPLEIPKDEQRHIAKKKGRYLDDEQMRKLLLACDERTLLIVSISASTGMRKMEIGSLELSRLKKIKDRYLIELDTDDTKTGLARIIPMPKYLNALIEAQINQKSKYLFPMLSNLNRSISSQLIDKGWREAKRNAGIVGKLRFHDLRHIAATNFAKSNISPIVACTILGMSFSTYQKIYLRLEADDLIIGVEAMASRFVGESHE